MRDGLTMVCGRPGGSARRWLARAVWLVCGTGCFAPQVPAGAPCDPLAPSCPYGQGCVPSGERYVCSTGPGDPPSPDASESTVLDTDGDQIADDVDLCPTTPDPDQDNEDGDRFGDACDPCPPIADDDPLDTDSDGVADACDPEPMVPGDRIVLFEGFHRPLTGWRAVGTWTVSADGATTSVGTHDEATLTLPAPAADRVTVSTAFLAGTLHPSPGYAAIGVVHLLDADGGVACQLARQAFANPYLALIDTYHDSALSSTASSLHAGMRYTTALTRAVDDYACRGGQTLESGTTKDMSPHVASAPEIGLRVHGATATFDWVLVVARP